MHPRLFVFVLIFELLSWGVHGAYLERGARPPGPPPPGDRFLKCTKTEEFSSFIATFRARGNILGRALVECTYKCTGGVGVQWAVVVGGSRANRSEANLAPQRPQSVPSSPRV